MDEQELCKAIIDKIPVKEQIRIVDESDLFDSSWYHSEYSPVTNKRPSEQYLEEGWKNKCLPSFDYPIGEIDFGICPVLYHELVGNVIGTHNSIMNYLKNSYYFDEKWYVSTYKHLIDPGEEPICHYLTKGWLSRCNPHPELDNDFYAIKNPDSKGMCPLLYHEFIAKRNGVMDGACYLPDKKKEIGFTGTYQAEIKYSEKPDVRTFAFYLPQFHRIPENDEWWGEGFTEWTNTEKARPSYAGHYEPRRPHRDIGFYNLTDVEVIKKQAELARSHGIDGFAIYYYWFSGKRLLEKPMEILYDHPEIDIQYCAVWANENWTRRWDGQEQNILMKQCYSEEDGRNFILDLRKYLLDPRYMRVDGKPVIIIYAPDMVPDLDKTLQQWRDTADEVGIGDIAVWLVRIRNHTSKDYRLTIPVEGEVQFPPHCIGIKPFMKIPSREETAILDNYDELVETELKNLKKTDHSSKLHRSVMLSWDNSPRKAAFMSFTNFSYARFCEWVRDVSKYTRANFVGDERVQFVNAWNEWAEGTYLEPDERCGYSAINTYSQGVLGRPCNGTHYEYGKRDITDTAGSDDKCPRALVQAHVFYVELLPELCEYLNNIPCDYDLAISTDTEDKKRQIDEYLKDHCSASEVYVGVFFNRGRDVGPFLEQISKHLGDHKLVCHLHTKKSRFRNDRTGDEWRRYLYDNLLGSRDYVRYLIDLFKNYEELGLVYPEVFYGIKDDLRWSCNFENTMGLLHRMGFEDCTLPLHPEFPAGTMFWAKAEALRPLFELNLEQHDFEEENGQNDGTLAHAIERSLGYVVENNGYVWVTANYSVPPKKCIFSKLADVLHRKK